MTKVVIAVLAALAAGSAVVPRAAPEPRVEVPREVRLARALAREQPPPAGFVTVLRSEQAWAEAQRRAARIPLPEGGNFNGISWTTGTQINTAQIEQVLEYNAFCQWLRARRDGRDPGVAQQVLTQVASWPAMRRAPVAAVVGERAPALVRAALDDCDRSHDREVARARGARLPPPT